MPQLNPLNPPIPQPRPAHLGTRSPSVNQPAPAAPIQAPQAQDLNTPSAPGGSAQVQLGFIDKPASDWQPLRDRLSSEMARIDKLPGYKADLNVDRLKGLIATLDAPADQQLDALAAQLKKAGYARDVGTPPTAAGVKASITRYLDDINKDYHLKPRK